VSFDLGSWWPAINVFTGAALGAAFYVLLKTQPYLVNRSFDPKYNSVYISRFITGVVGGVILATTITQVGTGTATGTSKNFSPGVLAILGGYAAEAVEQILQRLVEVLLAAVRGDGSAQMQASVEKEQAQKSAQLQEQLARLEIDKADPAKFSAALQEIRDTIKKG
jgi:hypothetical protein